MIPVFEAEVTCAPHVEVGWEVVVGIPVAVRTNDPDLFAAQPLPQCLENGDLVIDAVDPLDAMLVLFEDDLFPAAAHDTVNRDTIPQREVAMLALSASLEEFQGVDDRAVHRIVRA